jgi:cobalt-zinc-cadmium efflux system outer membrane protein
MAVTACASYHAQPVDLAQTGAQLQARTLPSQPQWDQAALLRTAAQWSPTLAEARTKLAESSAAVRTARQYPNPSLGLSAEKDIANGTTSSPWLWSVGSSFLLDTALARRIRLQIADAGVRGARLDFTEAVWTLRRDLRAALLSTLIAARRVQLLDSTIEARARLVALTEERLAAGEAAQTDRLQAQLELARARATRDDAERTRRASLIKLAAVVGVPGMSLGGTSLQWEALDEPQAPAPERLAQLRDGALLSRADLARAMVDYDVRENDLREQVRLQYPQLALGPGYTFDHGVRRVTGSLSFNLPILNRNQGPIAEAEARRATAAQHMLAVQAVILSEIETAQADLEVTLAALERASAQAQAAHQLADQTQRAFDLGGEDRPTLLSAQLIATTEDLARLDALERAQQAVGMLEDALRTPLYGPELNLPMEAPK